jgi:hypothetical protein
MLVFFGIMEINYFFRNSMRKGVSFVRGSIWFAGDEKYGNTATIMGWEATG